VSKRITIAILALLLVATSCASRKKTTAPTQPQSFEWLTANMSIQAEGNGMEFNDLSGQLRMRNDSLVWLNVTATMGVEVLRAKVSNDSVWLINRLETVSAQLGIPLSLPLLQTLLLDNNQGLPPVENQTVQLKTFLMGGLSAKIRYNNMRINEKTTFPLKIKDQMERMRLRIK